MSLQTFLIWQLILNRDSKCNYGFYAAFKKSVVYSFFLKIKRKVVNLTFHNLSTTEWFPADVTWFCNIILISLGKGFKEHVEMARRDQMKNFLNLPINSIADEQFLRAYFPKDVTWLMLIWNNFYDKYV